MPDDAADGADAGGAAARREREDGLRGVLLVEPNAELRRPLARGLERRRFAVIQAESEERARELLGEGGFDVVATAAEVGPSASREWLAYLADAWPSGRVCALVGDHGAADVLRHEHRRWRVLVKPVTAQRLADVLEVLLAGRRWSSAELRGHRGGAARGDGP